MTPSAPVVYLLHGDDEFAISQQLVDFEQKMGDPGLAELNTSRLDGRTFQLDQLLSIISAMPFLAKRRLVILSNPTEKIKDRPYQEKFLQSLNKTPETTALILVEFHQLINEKDKKKPHWLVQWAKEHDGFAHTMLKMPPSGPEMVRWIQTQAKTAGGTVSPQAAQHLVQLVGEEPRLINQEIQKLLAYVNYRRPVEVDDVQAVTADTAEGDIFILVDALGNRDQKRSMAMLQRLLEEQDPISIFAMVTRQFRLLLQVRELLDAGRSTHEMVQVLRPTPQFVIEKLIVQARRFQLSALESIYHHLLDMDEATKTGKMEGELMLQTLVTELNTSAG